MSYRFTDIETEFLRRVLPGRMWFEVSAEFEREFGFALTKNQVRHQRRKLGISGAGLSRTGLTPANKGRTWDEMGVSSECQARSREHTFKVGNVPKQGRRYEVGDERTDKDGYAWVKVCESRRDGRANGRRLANKCWRLKHHLVWEREHGEPVPKGHAVIFANRDKADFAPENIVAVPWGVLSTMNKLGMQYYDAKSLEACIAMANIRMALKRKKKEVTR